MRHHESLKLPYNLYIDYPLWRRVGLKQNNLSMNCKLCKPLFHGFLGGPVGVVMVVWWWWFSGSVVRWSGGPVVRWSGGPVVRRAEDNSGPVVFSGYRINGSTRC